MKISEIVEAMQKDMLDGYPTMSYHGEVKMCSALDDVRKAMYHIIKDVSCVVKGLFFQKRDEIYMVIVELDVDDKVYHVGLVGH